ncbi:hypothetical protein M426DRAFT_27307 [Hypoxylon sp. CI-4A]|nr:hypothetical protein M426DRAFT_27307 [Hypoxylon sp. CI-4A]
MKTSAVITFLAAAGLSVAQQARSVGDVAPSLRRAESGGFTHVGSDNVVRTFDRDLNVVDAAHLDANAPPTARSASASILEEVKQAKARSTAEASKPRSRSPLDERQEKSCVSENCPDDDFCKGLSVYGYDCSTCMMVSGNIGNCH